MYRLGLETPIIQAPMAGIETDRWLPYLVKPNQKINILPSYGAGYMQREAIESKLNDYKNNLDVFNFNLFIPSQSATRNNIELEKLWHYLTPVYQKLGVKQPEIPDFNAQKLFLDQLDLLLEKRVPVFSFTFGRLSSTYINEFKKNETFVIGSAASASGAQQLIADGCDAIVLQSPCAGGHLSVFDGETVLKPELSITDLVRQVQPKDWPVPCIAAGGIRNTEQVKKLFELGISAIQLGTPFLACRHSGIPNGYLQAVRKKNPNSSFLTSAVSGRYARTVDNSLFNIMNNYYLKNKNDFPAYPWPHLLTAPLRSAALKSGNVEFISAWCGLNLENIAPMDFDDIPNLFFNFDNIKKNNRVCNI